MGQPEEIAAVALFLASDASSFMTGSAIGPNEDRHINLTRVLVRLTITNGGEPGTGKWFKLQGRESPVHHMNITDCVFATDAPPRQGGWKSQHIPQDATFRGTNYLLWLGQPGAFGGQVPAREDPRLIELATAAESRAYCDDWRARLANHGVQSD